MGKGWGSWHELTLSDHHQILELSCVMEMVTYLPRGRRDSDMTIIKVTLINMLLFIYLVYSQICIVYSNVVTVGFSPFDASTLPVDWISASWWRVPGRQVVAMMAPKLRWDYDFPRRNERAGLIWRDSSKAKSGTTLSSLHKRFPYPECCCQRNTDTVIEWFAISFLSCIYNSNR